MLDPIEAWSDSYWHSDDAGRLGINKRPRRSVRNEFARVAPGGSNTARPRASRSGESFQNPWCTEVGWNPTSGSQGGGSEPQSSGGMGHMLALLLRIFGSNYERTICALRASIMRTSPPRFVTLPSSRLGSVRHSYPSAIPTHLRLRYAYENLGQKSRPRVELLGPFVSGKGGNRAPSHNQVRM